MTGTSTSATIGRTARAASSVFTVTRTSSLPAACSARTCAAVAAASAVSVLVIDWTTMGWALPTGTPPTLTVTVGRRVLTRTKYSAAGRGAGLEQLVRYHDPQAESGQPEPARHVGPDIGADPRANAYPHRVGVEDSIREGHRRGRQQRDGVGGNERSAVGRHIRRPGEDGGLRLRKKDVEPDAPAAGRIDDRRRRRRADRVDRRLPEPRRKVESPRKGGVRLWDAARNAVALQGVAGRQETQDVHIEDRASLTASRDEDQESGSKSLHGSPLNRTKSTWPS